jgi:hypothetical protein
MAERNPIFELHIRPMFRLLDRHRMLRIDPHLDLWDYDDVKASSAIILEKVKGPGPGGGERMPPERTGGEWPSEWISLFHRWVEGGFGRLTLGTARNLMLEEDSDLGVIHLTCRTVVPATSDGRSIAWFEYEFIPGAAMTGYRLYVLPGENLSAPPSTVEISCGARVDRPIPQEGITVIDAAGMHTVNLPSA